MREQIWIAGGTGYIGSHRIKDPMTQGYGILALDDPSKGRVDAVPASTRAGILEHPVTHDRLTALLDDYKRPFADRITREAATEIRKGSSSAVRSASNTSIA